MKLFYCRVSTQQQNEARQIKLAEELGIEHDNIYIDKVSGKNTNRPKLKELMAFCRKGDIIYCESISRMARNTKDLICIVEELTNKGVDFISIKENIDTNTPQGRFMLTVFAAIATLEREYILERQAEGIEIAKAEHRYKGRQPKKIDEVAFRRYCKEWRDGERTAVSIQKRFDISAQTFYRWVKEKNV